MADISGSLTQLNLARAFAGESQARTRYVIYAETARKEGYFFIARIFEEIAMQELSHAREFLEKININTPGKPANITFNAGYPYESGGTLANLIDSSKHENEEAFEIYPAFMRAAEQEGFPDISRLFGHVAAVEAEHSKLETALHTALGQGTLYSSDKPVKWKCSNCGYEQTTKDAPLICPLCDHSQGFFIPQAAVLRV